MKKRKPKLLLSHDEIVTYVTNLGNLSIIKHTQCKTGISLYSLNFNGTPLVTFDNLIFMQCLCEDYCNQVAEVSFNFSSILRNYSESEVFLNV